MVFDIVPIMKNEVAVEKKCDHLVKVRENKGKKVEKAGNRN
jgi:hypothetical protein